MDSHQPRSDSGVKAGASAGSAGAGVVVRRYPKPPALLPRMVFLCLKPESWAAAARYPSRYTMVPLVLAILIAGVVIGVSGGVRFKRSVETFAGSFPAMEVNSDGIMKPKEPLAAPVRYSFYPVRVVVDPSGGTTLANLQFTGTLDFIVTDRDIIQRGWNDSEVRYSLKNVPPIQGNLPEKGKTLTVDGASIRTLAPQLGIVYGLMAAMTQVIADVLWAAVIMFFLSPLITLVASMGERSLLLPRRAAYRMAAALLVPLILFNALMTAIGYSILTTMGGDFGLLFWFLGASGMAVWTGVMARRMYGSTKRHSPRQS